MTTPTAQRQSLRELRESTGTLFAKNNTNKRITCNAENVRFELDPWTEDGSGGPDAIQIVPKECLNVPGFQRLWMRGAITISDDEEMERQITLQQGGIVAFTPKVFTETFSYDKGAQQSEVEAKIQPAAESRDMVFNDNSAAQTPNGQRYPDVQAQARGYTVTPGAGTSCVWNNCPKPVFIQQNFLDDGEPPLCQDHAHLKPQVASTPQPDGSWHHQPISMQPVQKSDLPAGG